MNLETALTALSTAGYRLTSRGPDQWRVQFGQGAHARDAVMTDTEIRALVQLHAQPIDPAATLPLDLPQTVAMLRAAGLTVEPVGPGYWQVVFADGDRTLAQLFTAERLVWLGTMVVTAVPGLLRGQHPYWDLQQRTRRPVDPTEVAYLLARLGRVTSADLARLGWYAPEALAAALHTLTQAAHIQRGPEATWTLTPAGGQRIRHLVPADVALPTERDLPHPHLAMVVAQLIDDLRPLQLSRLELTYPGLAGPLALARGRSALLTVAPEPQGIAWTRNLAAQAAAAGVPSLHIAIELIEADRATSSTLGDVHTMLGAPTAPAPLFPCLVTADAGLAALVQAELRRWQPTGCWAVSSVDAAREGRWMTAPSGRLEVDLGLALRQVRN